MELWKDKVAIVTGASSGIGAAIVQKLVQHGVIVAGFARRVELVEALKKNIPNPDKLHPIKCDMTKDEEIIDKINWVKTNLGPVYILINNAAVLKPGLTLEMDSKDIRSIIETNVIGLTVATQEVVKDLLKNDRDGFVINVNSVVGHFLPQFENPNVNVYPPTKFSVTAFTEIIRQELIHKNNGTRISSISPGPVETDMFLGLLKGVTWNNTPTSKVKMLIPDDIADAVIYVLGLPPRVQVQEMMIRPVGNKH